MKRTIFGIFVLAASMSLVGCLGFLIGIPDASTKIIGHEAARLSILRSIPASAIAAAKSELSVYYGHTSHGSQLITGMDYLDDFMGNSGQYDYSFIYDGNWNDAGNYPDWYDDTVDYLGDVNGDGRGSTHPEVNVVMWSWCWQLSSMTSETLRSNYLEPMTELEAIYPGVKFVYMTGHLDGTGEAGNLNLRNEEIRAYCEANDKWLYDFADIESYDPDDVGYLDRYATDGCNYDYNGDGTTSETDEDTAEPINGDRNWATDWQNSHTEGVDWYDCLPSSVAHSKPLNGNLKAYAAWYLFARIAGWDGD